MAHLSAELVSLTWWVMPAVSKGTASNAIRGDDAKSLLLRGGGGDAWQGRGGRLDVGAWWWLQGGPSARVSAADVALGVSPARRVCGGGHHKPPARSMKRRGRNAREPVAFAAAAVDA